MNVHIIIPARYHSTRLPGKLLLEIGNKPIIQHVYEQARKSKADQVIVATDSDQIADCIRACQGTVCMTASTHNSGTERIGEVISQLGLPNEDVIINLQGDEPFLPPVLVDQLIDFMKRELGVAVSTLCESLQIIEGLFNPNVTKVVLDHVGNAIYFSRAPIPWYREGFVQDTKRLPKNFHYYRHVGIYAYRVSFVKKYIQQLASPLECIESLEQLRMLWYGEKIRVLVAQESLGPGIDTQDDLEKARLIFKAMMTAGHAPGKE